MKQIATGIVLLASAIGSAAPQGFAWTPTTVPLYYSGTNCRVNYSARAGSGERLREIKLVIGGEDTKSVVWGNTGQVKTGIINVVFDSSHFVNATNLETHINVKWDKLINNVWVQQPDANDLGSTSITVKNRSLAIMTGADVFTQQGIPMSLPQQARYSTEMSYLTSEVPGTVPWTYVSFLDNLYGKANLFINTHGQNGLPELCDSNLPYGAQHIEDNYTIFPSSILARREQTDIGVGQHPPLNPSAEPPVQIGIIFTCNQASSVVSWRNSFLWPGLNAYNDPPFTNQVIVAFNYYLGLNNNSLWNLTNRYLQRLKEGENVGNAAYLEFSEFAPPKPNENVYVLLSLNPQVPRLMEEGDFAFGGDDTARMSGVYTGNDFKMLTWWRN